MKFELKPMEVVKNFTAVVAAVSVLGGIAYAAGWIVSRAQASELIQQSALELQKKYDKKLLEVDIQGLLLQVGAMESKPSRSTWETEQLRIWKLQLDEKVKLLAEINATEKVAQ